jgi:peptidoglycan hydrolase CwlO-like protein
MDQFNLEQLRQVIIKYDTELKKLRDQLRERNDDIAELEEKLSAARSSAVHEDLEMYKEEARRLKDYLNVLTLQNEDLKR